MNVIGNRRRLAFASAAAFTLFLASPALAQNHEVHMLNKGKAGPMVFEPSLVRVAAGDTVTFLPTDKGHNAETIPGMLPAGAEKFKGALGKEVVVTFTAPGFYGIKCGPHLGLGMVAGVVVDNNLANLEEAKKVKLPKKAQERMGAIFTELSSK
jgi:pseudoazurin